MEQQFGCEAWAVWAQLDEETGSNVIYRQLQHHRDFDHPSRLDFAAGVPVRCFAVLHHEYQKTCGYVAAVDHAGAPQ
jgi:hypothetical protein